MTRDYKDLCIEDLSDAVAAQKEAVRQLIDLVADLALENVRLRHLWEREHLARLHADAHIRRLYERLGQQRRTAA